MAVERLTKFTPKKRAEFISWVSRGWTITTAAIKVGTTRQTIWELRKANAAFDTDCKTAFDQGTDTLEDVCRERADDGKDTTALIFLLKSRNRERFSDRIGIDFSKATPEQVVDAFRKLPLEKLDGNVT